MSMRHLYILNDHAPVPIDDVVEWGRWFESADRTVKKEDVGPGVQVSTVFLGLDHNWDPAGQPLLFETMVFRNGKGQEMDRCSTWDEAVAMHERMIEKVKAGAAQ